MKKKMLYTVLVFALAVLLGVPALYAVTNVAEDYKVPGDDYSDPSAFEGNPSGAIDAERAPENPQMADAPAEMGFEKD